MDEAERLSDRLAIMDHGAVLVEGTPRELIAALGGDHVVEFASTHPLGRGCSEACRRSRGWTGGRRARLTTREPHRTIPALYELVESTAGS
jgi:ABC-2 type transport system ATP-binding protein